MQSIVGPARLRVDAPLARLTTFRVGGPADLLVEVHTAEELRAVLAAARRADAPVTMLGGGSNVLIADAGVRGVVVRFKLLGLEQPAPDIVRAGAGATMNGLVRWTIGRGLAALEAWAGTPGTVGGAIYGNAHYGGRNIGDLVSRVQLMSRDGVTTDVSAAEMEFAYDTSRLQRSRELLVWAEFRVTMGGPDALRATARASLAHRKRTQPLDVPSAGCIFQNPDGAREQLPDGVPASAGALIDRAGLKGHRIGGAMISTAHANFIVNDHGATASDIHALIETARRAVRERFGVELRDEVVRMGEH
ncbi:MAG: UDP-N-acetylmuramate dehydrogenase [Acidobacteria bacterium]|nr:UDP-N-acetylmuramate dehydrogenase [Acidobacteriota bacterium]